MVIYKIGFQLLVALIVEVLPIF